MTKEHIEKVIRSNRSGIAAHQLWKEIERENASPELIEKLATAAWSVLNFDNDPEDSRDECHKAQWNLLKSKIESVLQGKDSRNWLQKAFDDSKSSPAQSAKPSKTNL